MAEKNKTFQAVAALLSLQEEGEKVGVTGRNGREPDRGVEDITVVAGRTGTASVWTVWSRVFFLTAGRGEGEGEGWGEERAVW